MRLSLQVDQARPSLAYQLSPLLLLKLWECVYKHKYLHLYNYFKFSNTKFMETCQ
jgi:hypothetical protein